MPQFDLGPTDKLRFAIRGEEKVDWVNLLSPAHRLLVSIPRGVGVKFRGIQSKGSSIAGRFLG